MGIAQNLLGSGDWGMFGLSILFVVGLVFIIKGGDFFVDAATWMAEVSGIPQFIIGATIVSVATTLPELIVSLIGAKNGSFEIAIGNAVGSVTANTGLIMAISIICMPGIIKRSQYAFKSILLMVATAILYGASFLFGEKFSVIGSILLVIIFIIATAESIKTGKAESGESEKVEFKKKDLPVNIVKFLVGAAGIAVGADFLVDSATGIATKLGVSEAIIAATIVAIGTSLPELVTTITAVIKKQSDLSVGNIIGANLIDIALILPVCSLVSGGNLSAVPQNLWIDIPVCLGIAVIALVPMLIRKKFSRGQGIVMLACYIAYVVVISFVVRSWPAFPLTGILG